MPVGAAVVVQPFKSRENSIRVLELKTLNILRKLIFIRKVTNRHDFLISGFKIIRFNKTNFIQNKIFFNNIIFNITIFKNN